MHKVKCLLTITCLILVSLSMNLQAADVDVINDISADATWTSDNVYLLNGLIFVDSLATLTIQPGTVIKGREQASITSGDGASALIVRRGGKLYAEGTAADPIIFTSELDDLDDPEDLGSTDRGLWGGVILLGKATTNEPSTNIQIEGVPTTENARYGGSDDTDNSGSLKYVSIRHGGFSISGVAGDEINGLTMGAVGNQTTIEHIEVYANDDDGYEWFGGTVNTKWLIAAFCKDDCFDYDQGFRGKGQFWFSIQAADESGRAGEHDGGDTDETGTPYSLPVIYNATYIGSGSSAAPAGDGNDHVIYFRDNAGGKYTNSIFTDFTGDGLKIEDLESGEDSRSRLENGDLVLNHNIWWNFGAGSTLETIIPDEFVRTNANFSNPQVVDPLIQNITRLQDGTLDPRPLASSPAADATVLPPDDGFYTQADYIGAFDPAASAWHLGWTALDQEVTISGVEEAGHGTPFTFSLAQNYPNPFNPTTTIEYSVASRSFVKLEVFNLLGQNVATLVNGYRSMGVYKVQWNAENLNSGLYIYQLNIGNKILLTNKMMLLR